MTVLNKIILKTAATGLFWTVIAFSFFLGLFAAALPKPMANFFDTVGNRHLASIYHARVYDVDPTPQNLFYALTRAVDAGNDGYILKYGEKFFGNGTTEGAITAAERGSIIADVDAHLTVRAAAAGDINALGFACNTDDRLRRAYIRALIDDNDIDTAAAVFNDAIATVDLDRPSYAILEFENPTDEQKTDFENYHADFVVKYGNPQIKNYKAEYFIKYGWEWYYDEHIKQVA